MFSKFKKRRLQRKFLILLFFILSNSSTLQSAQNELTNPTRYPNICSVYGGGLIQGARDPKGQRIIMEELRHRMQQVKEEFAWSLWQEKLAKGVSNSDHARTLLELGFQMRSVYGIQRMVSPENFLIPFEIYNHRVLEMIKKGQLQNSEAIFATLLFESVENIREIKTFRPGIDETPNGHHWRISRNEYISHSDWASFIGSGHMPVDIGSLYQHDLAHMTENLRIDLQTQRPEFMIAVRAVYREQTKEFDRILTKESTLRGTQPNRSVVNHFQSRSSGVLEYMSLGRLDSEARLRTLRPELFGNQTSLEALQQNLQRLSFEELDVRLKYWLENESEFVLKQGGAERDMTQMKEIDDLYHVLDRMRIYDYEHLAGYLRNASIIIDYILRPEELPSRRTVRRDGEVGELSMHLSAEKLTNFRKALDTDKTELEKIKAQIVDQLARFEMGLVKSVELKLNPAQLVYDLAGAHVKSNSPSVEWLRSYLDPSGERYSLFIDNR